MLTIYPPVDAVTTSEDAGRAICCGPGYLVSTESGLAWPGLSRRTQAGGKIPGRALRAGVAFARHPAGPGQGALVQIPGRPVLTQRAGARAGHRTSVSGPDPSEVPERARAQGIKVNDAGECRLS